MIPKYRSTSPTLRNQPEPETCPEELPSVAIQQKNLCSKLKQVYLTKRVITDTESFLPPPDIDSIRQLKTQITDAIGKIHNNDRIEADVSSKMKLLDLLVTFQSCLNHFEGKQIPNKYPDYSRLGGMFNDPETVTLFSDIFSSFKKIADARSAARVDKAMITKLACYLKDCSCLEVYAGNGWLSSELRKKGVSIHATDNFQRDKDQSSHFLQDVKKSDALDATLKFLSDLPHGKEGVVLFSFSEGDYDTLLNITASPLIRKGIRVICIEPPGRHELIRTSMELISTDITEAMSYTPSICGERVYEYRAPEGYQFLLAP